MKSRNFYLFDDTALQNPDKQLAMSQDFYESSQSLFSFNYTLPEDSMLGEWQVLVLYGDGFKQSETITFAMKEYVLPTFRVEVDMAETLIPSMKSVPVRVKATHVYGKAVRGQVMIKEFLEAAVGDPQQQRESIPSRSNTKGNHPLEFAGETPC